jgi:predicted PurR-regulated permease PerM
MSQRGQQIVLSVLLATLLLLLLRIFWPFASSLLLASIVAVVANPVKQRLSRRLSPGTASFVTTFAAVIVLAATITFVGVTVFRDLVKIHGTLSQRSTQEGGWSALITNRTDRFLDAVSTRFPLDKDQARDKLREAAQSGAGYLVNKIQATAQNVASLTVTIILAAIFLYYLLRHGEEWVQRGSALVPLSPETTAHLVRTAHHSIIANVNGVIIVALAQGAFLTLGFWFLGISSPLLWGIFGAIASVIPFVGATIVWVPFVIGLVITGAYWKALALGLWGSLVVGTLDNILRPWVVGAHEKQNPVLVGFAMLGGTYAFGPFGLLLAPFAVSMTTAVVEELHRVKSTSNAAASDAPQHAAANPAESSSSPRELTQAAD